MLSVTQLAQQYSISRTTVLYYERVGLLKPAYRSNNHYRWYGEREQKRLQAVLIYRAYGVVLWKIRTWSQG